MAIAEKAERHLNKGKKLVSPQNLLKIEKNILPVS